MAKKEFNEQMYDDGTYSVEKKKKFGLLAFLLCIVISFAIWIYVTNQEREELQEGSGEQTGETVMGDVEKTSFDFI